MQANMVCANDGYGIVHTLLVPFLVVACRKNGVGKCQIICKALAGWLVRILDLLTLCSHMYMLGKIW